jgi:hypothetical protein
MRVSVPENFQNSAVGRFLFFEKLFSAVDFSRSVSMSGFERLDRLSLPRRTRRRVMLATLVLQPHPLTVASVVVQFRQRKLRTQPHSTGRNSLL